MMEIGPYRVQAGGNLEYNNGSWDEFANVLFVDQPVGTGFSYVNTNSYLSELDQATNHMIIFLEKFFGLFPEYEHDDVSISPEARIYAPVLTCIALSCWRILCWPIHSIHRARYP
jgi:carboxypeptidase D